MAAHFVRNGRKVRRHSKYTATGNAGLERGAERIDGFYVVGRLSLSDGELF